MTDPPADAGEKITPPEPSEHETEASRTYLRFREIFGGVPRGRRGAKKRNTEKAESVPFGKGRDPHGLGDVIDTLTGNLGWNPSLSQSELLDSWEQIAGEETAKHSTPLGISEGVLSVACESTAWATQLRLMRVDIMTHIHSSYPDAGIESIRFQGPNAPSWKKGPRSIPGRGPRDTYG